MTVSDEQIAAGVNEMLNAKARTPREKVRAILEAALSASPIEAAGQDMVMVPRSLDEWSEEHGDVVWWCWDAKTGWLGEPPYIGSPLDAGQTIEIELRSNQGEFIHQHQVGGWPGYHTHWTPRPAIPQPPFLKGASNAGK